MHARGQHHSLTFVHIFCILLARDHQVVALVASKCFTKSLALAKLRLYWVCHNAAQVIEQVCVRVWVAVCKVYSVVGVLKVVRERVCVVLANT